MTMVRPCERDDLPGVARLYSKSFNKPGMAGTTLSNYLGDLHLGNPWVDAQNPSLVAESPDHRIVGFMGSVPMPLRLYGRPVRSVVGGNFMVDRDHKDPLAAARLLKSFLGGPHDLALTDTASPVAVKMWEAFGGELAQYQSMRWVLPLMPMSLGVWFAARSKTTRRLASTVAPALHAVDGLVQRRRRTSAEKVSTTTVRPVDSSFVHGFLTDVDDQRRVQFAGTVDEFAWLTGMAARKTQFGPLRTIAVYGKQSTVAGVVIYYPNRHGLGQVALAAATAGNHDRVLSALREDAIEQGSAGLMGQADIQFSMALSASPSVYVLRNDFVMLHASDASLIAPLLTGDASLGRLSGEWWTRTQGDSFD